MGYYNDFRVRAAMRGCRADESRFVVEDENGDEIKLPTEYILCPTCEGRGTPVNPSIDSHGLSAEDFYEDPDFAEGYLRGDYDIPCNDCGGLRVIFSVSEKACASGLFKLWREKEEDEAEALRERAAELEYGY